MHFSCLEGFVFEGTYIAMEVHPAYGDAHYRRERAVAVFPRRRPSLLALFASCHLPQLTLRDVDMRLQAVHELMLYVDKKLDELNHRTCRWGSHILAFSSLGLLLATSSHIFFRIPHQKRWYVRREIGMWCTIGAVVSYCSCERQRYRRVAEQDADVKRIVELRKRVQTTDWWKVPMSFQGDHFTPLIGDEDTPISFFDKFGLFVSRTMASDTSRIKYMALLRPQVQAGCISTQDYDLCITALANKTDKYAFVAHCAGSAATIISLSLLLLAWPRTRSAAQTLPLARMLAAPTIAVSTALYFDSRLPTEFRDKPSVIRTLEKLLPDDPVLDAKL